MLKQLFLVALILGLLGGLYFLVGTLDTGAQLTGFAVRESSQQQQPFVERTSDPSSLSDDRAQKLLNQTPEPSGESAQFNVQVRVVGPSEPAGP